jgi:two-component system chemotaxis sensor kinase CheA
VAVAAAMRGDRIVVTVTDDGAGMDVQAMRDQLERTGIPVPAAERDVVNALFAGGVSTRTEATAISGRGVGLDIVRAAAARIRGHLDVTWEAGRGTTFSIECPPTLATIRALLVGIGPQTVAIPTIHIARLIHVSPDAIKRAEGREVIATPDGPVPLASLARLLPPLVERPVTGKVPVVILLVGDRRLAVVVDDLIAEEEIVLRPLNVGRASLPYLSGATLLGSGRVALVLDPPAIVAAALGLGAGAGLTLADTAAEGPAKRRILVVDDSITTRTLEQSILEAAGYEVVTAADGVAGWKALQENGVDLVVADVEMPRMDGLALCEAIRGSKRFKATPVVLVTALETAEHRARGFDVGADAYLAKSSFDQQNLLDTLAQLLG